MDADAHGSEPYLTEVVFGSAFEVSNVLGAGFLSRYRELFRQEIADTVADPTEVESELRFLAAVLTRR